MTARLAVAVPLAALAGIPLSLAPFASLSIWLAGCLLAFLYVQQHFPQTAPGVRTERPVNGFARDPVSRDPAPAPASAFPGAGTGVALETASAGRPPKRPAGAPTSVPAGNPQRGPAQLSARGRVAARAAHGGHAVVLGGALSWSPPAGRRTDLSPP